jgi:hypothetical protein
MATMMAEHLLKQIYGNHACTEPTESASDRDELYGSWLSLPPFHWQLWIMATMLT